MKRKFIIPMQHNDMQTGLQIAPRWPLHLPTTVFKTCTSYVPRMRKLTQFKWICQHLTLFNLLFSGIKYIALHISNSNVLGISDHSVILTEDTDSFIIGERVWVGGTKPGQIAYIGETQFAPGEWAGIVLDEPIGEGRFS